MKKYNCDVCFTPMIMADSFVQSEQARQIEFATNSIDNPLVVQFAANKVDDFVDATEMVSRYLYFHQFLSFLKFYNLYKKSLQLLRRGGS